MRELLNVQDGALREICDPFVHPRSSKHVKPKASWLTKSSGPAIEVLSQTKAAKQQQAAIASFYESQRFTPRSHSETRSPNHSRPGRFALAEGTQNLWRPGSARIPVEIRPPSRPEEPNCNPSRPSSAARQLFDSLAQPQDAITAKKSEKPETDRIRLHLADRLNVVAEKDTSHLSERRPLSARDRANTTRGVMAWKKSVALRTDEKDLPPYMQKILHPKPPKKSMFQSWVKHPDGNGWPRPQVDPADAQITGEEFVNWLDSRPVSPMVEETKMNLSDDARRFEQKYDCDIEMSTMDLYRGPPSRSHSPQLSRTASPAYTGGSETPMPFLLLPEWRPETPHLQYDGEELCSVQQPRPPDVMRAESPPYAGPRAETPKLDPFYSSVPRTKKPTLFKRSTSVFIPDAPPKRNVSSIRRWFDLIANGGDFVRRKDLIFALMENEEAFQLFCCADLHRYSLDVAEDTGQIVDIAGHRRKHTEEFFRLRTTMLRQGLDTLDRIDWEWKHGNKPGKERRRHSLSQGSLKRKLAFPVFLTYFRYFNLILDYNDTQTQNPGWDWSTFRKRSSVFRGPRTLEEFTRTCMAALGYPTPPDDDDPDESENLPQQSDSYS